MQTPITVEKALEDLYKACRLVNGSAEAHEHLRVCKDILEKFIQEHKNPGKK